MKRIAWGVAMAFAALAIFGAGVLTGRGLHRLWYDYHPPIGPSILQQARRSAQLHDAVFFFGDSQTDGFATTNLAPNSGNFGLTADNTVELGVQIGGNDWSRDRFANLGVTYPRMLAAIPAAKPVIAIAILPYVRGALHDPPLAVIGRANAVERRACAPRPGCLFVESPLAGPDGYLRPAFAQADGAHLSPAGYQVWSESMLPFVGRQ